MLHLGIDIVFPVQSQFDVPKSNKTTFFAFIPSWARRWNLFGFWTCSSKGTHLTHKASNQSLLSNIHMNIKSKQTI
jgi:hypothetical protein